MTKYTCESIYIIGDNILHVTLSKNFYSKVILGQSSLNFKKTFIK